MSCVCGRRGRGTERRPGVDTAIDLSSGGCSGLRCVATQDDTLGCGVFTILSATVAPGEYYVAVYGFMSVVGNFRLTATCGVSLSGLMPAPPAAFGGPSSALGCYVELQDCNAVGYWHAALHPQFRDRTSRTTTAKRGGGH